MALVIYPAVGWDSFASLQDIDTIIATFIGTGQWDQLSEEEREVRCRQATMAIASCDNIMLPDDTSKALAQAEAFTAYYLMTNNRLFADPNERAVKREKVDTLEVEYDTSLKEDALPMPSYVYQLLGQYGCKKPSSGGFSQTSVGRS